MPNPPIAPASTDATDSAQPANQAARSPTSIRTAALWTIPSLGLLWLPLSSRLEAAIETPIREWVETELGWQSAQIADSHRLIGAGVVALSLFIIFTSGRALIACMKTDERPLACFALIFWNSLAIAAALPTAAVGAMLAAGLLQ